MKIYKKHIILDKFEFDVAIDREITARAGQQKDESKEIAARAGKQKDGSTEIAARAGQQKDESTEIAAKAGKQKDRHKIRGALLFGARVTSPMWIFAR